VVFGEESPPVDPNQLRLAFEKVRKEVQAEIDWLYETRCDRCGGKATTGYTVYSQVFQCPRCLTKIPLYDCGVDEAETSTGKTKPVNVCPTCKANGFTEVIRSQSEKFGFVPVWVVYHCENGCKPAREERAHDEASEEKRSYFERYDRGKIEEIRRKQIPHWFPPHRMMNVEDDTSPWGDKWRAGTSSFRTVADLFTKRNLWALATIRHAIGKIDETSIRDALMFGLTGVCLRASKIYQESEGGRGFTKGTYYIPQVFREMVVTNGFDYKVDTQLTTAYEQLRDIQAEDICISTQSATDLAEIPSNSIDYIFTDPPYGDKVQYGELNFVWEAWLDVDTSWHDEEIIVNAVRGKSATDWAALMKKAVAECFRVLKPGRWLSLCYHDTSEGTWALIQDIMAEVGFVVDKSDRTLFIDAAQKSYNQRIADKTTKRDLVLNFRKPKVGEFVMTRTADGRTFRSIAVEVIRAYLIANPGATKDRIYDELVSRLVQAGKMEAHDFNALLRSVAEEVQQPIKKNLFEYEEPDLFGSHVSSRWYLKDSSEGEVDEAESALEDAAARKLAKFLKQRLEKDPTQEGVHYSDIFEHFLSVVSVQEWPRRKLWEWLPDYFFKTLSGTWRVPATPEEEELKARGRRAGTNRRIRHFLALLDSGDDIPDRLRPSPSDLAEWIRHCQRSAMFDEGRRLYLYGQGDWVARLPDEVGAGVEEDYQICLRALQRATAPGAGAGKKGGRKPGRKARDTNDD
jgi:hypothetical protein